MVKITSRWFPYSRYASVMGVVSLSFLFGDAAGRQLMGLLIGAGLGWRGIFGAAAASLALIALANALLLRESPGERGLAEPEANPQSLFALAEGEAAPTGLRSLLRPFLTSSAFWIVCLLSFGFTLLREAFNTWTPTYFTEAVGLGQADAAARSALFPFFGGVSVLLAGFLGDASGRRGRAALILAGLLGTCAALAALASARPGPLAASTLVALVGFLMIGPYSYLAGAISLDFGGKQGSATACGLIDGVGYLGGILSGEALARVAVAQGWAGAFAALALVAAATAVVAAAFLVVERRAAPSAHAPGSGR
jgi:OPA family glycerol-3-phosphate transporter-like MFS transporter